MVALGVGAVAAIHWAAGAVNFRLPDRVKLIAFILVIALAYYLVYSDKWKAVGKFVVDLAACVARWF